MKRIVGAIFALVASFSTSLGAYAPPAAVSYQLLSSATATGSAVTVQGGNYLLDIRGTFGGATVTLNETINGVTIPLASYTASPNTVAYSPSFNIAAGTVLQAVVSGGSPSGLYATLGGVGPGPAPVSVVSVNANTGTVTQPADVSCAANTVCSLLTTTSRKTMRFANTSASGLCRIAYSGITPSATVGAPLGAGNSTAWETSYVPTGTVSEYCTVASTTNVLEGL